MATTLEKRNAHPRDKRIRFDEGPHIYYLDKKALPISVTGFIHKFFNEFDADAIIPRLISNPKKERYFGRSVADVKKEWKDIADKASALGTKMHLAIELFYNGELEDHPEEAAHFHGSKEEALFMEFHREIVEGSPLVPYRTEWSVFTDKYNLAGQIDMAYYNTATDTLELYDWKRSKKIEKTNRWDNGKGPVSHLPDSNFWHYSLQLNVYKFILESEYGMTVSGMYLVFLHPNQDSYIREEISDFQYEVRNMFEAHVGRWNPVVETASMEVDDAPFEGIKSRRALKSGGTSAKSTKSTTTKRKDPDLVVGSRRKRAKQESAKPSKSSSTKPSNDLVVGKRHKKTEGSTKSQEPMVAKEEGDVAPSPREPRELPASDPPRTYSSFRSSKWKPQSEASLVIGKRRRRK